jgi:hypothetical protein
VGTHIFEEDGLPGCGVFNMRLYAGIICGMIRIDILLGNGSVVSFNIIEIRKRLMKNFQVSAFHHHTLKSG